MPVRYPAAASISARVTSSGCIIDRPEIGVDHAGAIVVPAGQQAGAGRCADGRYVEVLEPHALPGERVEVWRLDLGIAVRPQIAVALVVGHDDDDVGPRIVRSRSPERPPSRLNRRDNRDSHAALHEAFPDRSRQDAQKSAFSEYRADATFTTRGSKPLAHPRGTPRNLGQSPIGADRTRARCHARSLHM